MRKNYYKSIAIANTLLKLSCTTVAIVLAIHCLFLDKSVLAKCVLVGDFYVIWKLMKMLVDCYLPVVKEIKAHAKKAA